MNIDFSEYYDEEADVYYVTFKTGEPSGVLEMDDILLLEVGVFTGLPTGFRILNYSKHKISGVKILGRIDHAINTVKKDFPAIVAQRTQQMHSALEKTLVA